MSSRHTGNKNPKSRLTLGCVFLLGGWVGGEIQIFSVSREANVFDPRLDVHNISAKN